MRYIRLFGYLICFAFATVTLILVAQQATLVISLGEATLACCAEAEKQINSTVEIYVERAFDADMGVYDYQLVGKSGEATPVKRGRKRMSQLREDY